MTKQATTNYIMPMKQTGICALSAIVNSVECVQAADMEQLCAIIALTKKSNMRDELQHYLQTGAIFWDFKGPILLQKAYPYFNWFSSLLIDFLSSEKVTEMIEEGITLEDEMNRLRCGVCIDSYIAVVDMKSTEGILKAGHRHVFNLKYIEEFRFFIRQDQVEPHPKSIGISDQNMLQEVKEMSIYAWHQTDRTKMLHQANGAGVSAYMVYEKLKLPLPMKFD